jgi:thiamine monophosphate kinase
MNTPIDPPVPPTGTSVVRMTYLSVSLQSSDVDSIPRGEVHVGDDAAVLAPFAGETLISTDVAVLGRALRPGPVSHWRTWALKPWRQRSRTWPLWAGDPRACVVAVSSPPGTDLEELHRGIADAATITKCPVVGGDLTRSHDVSVAVTVLGECPDRGAILRSGAQADDEILVTGPLGRAAAGLRRRREPVRRSTTSWWSRTADRGRASTKALPRAAPALTR